MTKQNTFSFSELQQKANDGDALAQFSLGLYYLPKEVWESKEGWEFVDSLYGQYRLAFFGERIIEAKIYSAFKLVETNNEANVELAFLWFKKAAEQDRAESQYAIARCYYEGKGTEQNDKLAFEWAKKSVDQGFAEAFCLLGDLFSQGRGVGQDDGYALTYYQDAVSGENRGAYIKWIRMILRCKGIVDSRKAQDAVETFRQELTGRLGKRIELINKHRFFGQELPFVGKNTIDIPEDDENFFEDFLYAVKRDSEWLITELKEISLVTMEYKLELDAKNKALEVEIKQKEEAQKALNEKEKEMLSFFTHTMRNALATAPESLRQAIHLLGSDVYEKDTKHYQAINKIAALFSTLSLTDCLIDTFKQSISDPQEFKQSWRLDHSGNATPRWVIASALKQSLNRIIFMSDTTELRKLLISQETALVKATRKSFIEEVLPLNVDQQGVDAFFEWSHNHVPTIEVVISDADNLSFGVNQIRFSLLFAITSELILNALKYWDGENRIQIGWQLAEQDNYVFSVKNHCKANAASNLAGTHKGLAFINRLVELLGDQAHFVCKTDDQLFTTELILNKALFDEES